MPARGFHANPLALPTGTRLAEYELEGVLGSGGFGITYRGRDVQLGLGVAIKEFLPVSLATRKGTRVVPQHHGVQATFRAALGDFVREAQLLAAVQHHNIVRVIRYIEANGTAYLVMELLEGRTMSEWLRALRGQPREQDLRAILGPVMDGLEAMHRQDLLHRDIKPENIFLTKGGRPVLIDFGSARESLHASVPVASIVSAGYSPFELYGTKVPPGPWTDIYSLGAAMHTAVTGDTPPDATMREMKDTRKLLALSHGKRYSRELLTAIDACLQIQPKHRPQNIATLRRILHMDTEKTDGTRWLQGSSGLLVLAAASGLLAVGLVIWVLLQPSGESTGTAAGFEISEIELAGDHRTDHPVGGSEPRPPTVTPAAPDPVPSRPAAPAEVATYVTEELLAGGGTTPAARLIYYPPTGVSRNDEGGEVQPVALDVVKWDLEEMYQTYRVRTFTSRQVSLESHDTASDTMVLRQEYDCRLVRRDNDSVDQTRKVRLVTVKHASTSLRRISGWQVVSCYHRYQARLSATDGASALAPASSAEAETALRAMLRKDRLNHAAGAASQDHEDEPCAFLTTTDKLSLLSTAQLSCFDGATTVSAERLCHGTPLVEVLVCDGSHTEDSPQEKLIVRKLPTP